MMCTKQIALFTSFHVCLSCYQYLHETVDSYINFECLQVLRAHILPLTNVAFNKNGSR